jgi:hypothetical protein
MDHHDRESLKQEAWQQFSNPGATIDDKVRALHMVAEAHFWRSAEGVRRHPEFREFIRHWVWASMPHFGSFQDETARDEMRRRYPRPKVLKIGDGRSTWGSKPYPL